MHRVAWCGCPILTTMTSRSPGEGISVVEIESLTTIMTPPPLESLSFLKIEYPVGKISLSKVELDSHVSVQQNIEVFEE